MKHIGHVKNGAIIIDSPSSLPEGAIVSIELLSRTPETANSHVKSLKGLYAGQGPVPSLDEMIEIRRETWPND